VRGSPDPAHGVTVGLQNQADRRGFTLLEMLLSLGLTTVLMTIVGMAIHLYLGTVEGCRSDVQQAELARNLLKMIASDLHNTVPFASDESSQAGGGESASAEGSDGGEGETAETGEEAPAEEEEVSTIVETLSPPSVPGVYGNQYELQVDVSRLPRIDQMERLLVMDDPQLIHRVSDMTTVGYYVGQPGIWGGMESTTAETADGSGLIRRTLDRAVAQWAAENGGQALLADSDQLVAPEVIAIEFRYFDGIEWTTSWDSEARAGLPLAVEIALMMAVPDEDASAAVTPLQPPVLLNSTTTTTGADEDSIYRLIVQLPVAQMATADAATTTTGGF
jgi:prepilin-type N-terminal cleavage/methylation domain-containing protein